MFACLYWILILTCFAILGQRGCRLKNWLTWLTFWRWYGLRIFFLENRGVTTACFKTSGCSCHVLFLFSWSWSCKPFNAHFFVFTVLFLQNIKLVLEDVYDVCSHVQVNIFGIHKNDTFQNIKQL